MLNAWARAWLQFQREASGEARRGEAGWLGQVQVQVQDQVRSKGGTRRGLTRGICESVESGWAVTVRERVLGWLDGWAGFEGCSGELGA